MVITNKKKKKEQGIVPTRTDETGPTEDELRTQRRKAPDVDITEENNGTSTTRFGVRPPPEGIVRPGGNIQIATSQEELKSELLLPREEQVKLAKERFENRQQDLFDAGVQSGAFEGLSLNEVNRIAEERGIIPPKGQTVENAQDKSFLQKTAELGITPAVATANLISKALGAIGINIGTITKEQFASTTIGKTLGFATAGAATIAAGMAAWALIPASGATATVTTGARAAVGTNAIRTGLFARLSSNKILTALVGGFVVSKIEGRVADLETSIVNQRETITLIGSAVQNGAISPTEAILMFNDLEADINQTEAAIHFTQNISVKAWLGKGKEVETRVQKAKSQLTVERGRLVQFVSQ